MSNMKDALGFVGSAVVSSRLVGWGRGVHSYRLNAFWKKGGESPSHGVEGTDFFISCILTSSLAGPGESSQVPEPLKSNHTPH